MSRTIRFRAWDNANNEWLNKEDAECLIIHLDGRYEIDRGWVNVFPDLTIEQDTGLKDKNGKEIYEGDILWWEHFYGMTGENIETTAKVYWEEKDASFVVGDWFEPLGHLVDEDEIEVIGNVHENKELLEGEE